MWAQAELLCHHIATITLGEFYIELESVGRAQLAGNSLPYVSYANFEAEFINISRLILGYFTGPPESATHRLYI